MNRKSRLLGVLSILMLALPAMTLSASAAPVQRTTTTVMTHPSQGPVTEIEGASAMLWATDAGIFALMQTRQLEIGHPHTLWIVMINRPELCEATPCTPNDVLMRTDIVEANVVYGAGRVIRGDSTPFMTFLPTGDVDGGWFDNALTNPKGAEIHLVLQDHGPMIPGLTLEMTRTLRAGCTDASIPAAYPPVAFADGTPGPNTCRLVQAAIFQQ
jgi:hypothetical protein